MASHAIHAVHHTIMDYENNCGLVPSQDYELVVVLNSKGGIFALDPTISEDTEHKLAYKNMAIADQIKDFMTMHDVKFKLCNITLTHFLEGNENQIIDGIELVPSGVTTTMDLQDEGYTYYAAL